MTPDRWDNLYERNSHLKCNARIKWEEYRISIGRQELNWLYAKYQPHGDPILSLCSFCRTEEEDEIHLQGGFFDCSAQKMTKYKEKLKYQNCSANCSSQKILSTKKTKYQNNDLGTCVFVHLYLACQSKFSSVANAVQHFSGQ